MARPQRLGRYELLEVLGKGAMGIVYRARDDLLDRTLAVKTCYEDVAASTLGRQRFEREVKAAGRLHHPNIVVVFDGGIEGDTPFIAMELVDGPTLAVELERHGGKVAPAEAARLTRKIAEGLDYAHKNGVVHRDLKPANILLTSTGDPKISDFGVAKLLSADAGVTETPVGTPRNMSPEQVSGSPIDGRSDVFALGILAYEMLTGISPFAGEHFTAVVYNILNHEPKKPSEANPALPPAVDAAIMRALAKDKNARTSDPLALADELDRALGEAPAAAPRRTRAPGEAADTVFAAPAGGRRGRNAEDHEFGIGDLEAFRDLGGEREPSKRPPWGLIGGVAGGIIGVIALLLAMRSCGSGEAPPAEPTAVPTAMTQATPPDQIEREVRRPTAAPTRRPTAPPTRVVPAVVPTRQPTAAPPPTEEPIEPTVRPSPRATATAAATAAPTATPEPTGAPESAVDVLSQPLGAEIVIDGDVKGKTPMRVSGLTPGGHDLEVRKTGFLSYRQRIEVEADSRYELNVKLASEVNSLRIVTEPPGARLEINGEDKGVTPSLLDSLPTGAYEIVVEWPDGHRESRKIDLAGGQLTEVRFRLTTVQATP